MGKNKDKNSQQQPQQLNEDIEEGSGRSSLILCYCCCRSIKRSASSNLSKCLGFTRNAVSSKCVLYLVLGFAAFLFVILWVQPFLSLHSGFEAKQNLKISASVHAYFRLPKPVSDLVLKISVLEYDIQQEIGVPHTKVAVLSMHQSPNASNATEVIFGVLSDPIDAPINPMSLSVLKLSLVELFLQQANLTLTSIFGRPYDFQILKCPRGITINPEIYAPTWQIRDSLFNFTLYRTMSNIKDNFTRFKDQLESGLHLKKPGEVVNVQITSHRGSTKYPPSRFKLGLFHIEDG